MEIYLNSTRGEKMAYKKIGIDLGVNFIKISRIKVKNNNYIIESAKKYNVSYDYNNKEYFDLVRKFLRDFLRINKIIFADLHFTIPCDNENLIVKPFSIPYVEEKLLNKTIEYEIETTILSNIEEYEYKYIITNKPEDLSDIDKFFDYDITVALLKKEIIELILDFNSFKWKVKNIEPQISLGSKIIKDNSIIIDFGYELTRIYLYRDGQGIDLDIVPIGSKNFTDPVKSFSMDKIDEDFLDSELAAFFIGEKHEELSEKITQITKSFTNEFKRSIRAMELNNQILVKNFYYSGGLANIQYFINYISEDLSVELKPLEITEDYTYEEGSIKNKNDFIFSILSTLDINRPFNFLYNRKKKIDYNSILIGLICGSIALNIGVYDINRRYIKRIDDTEFLLEEINNINEDLDLEIEALNNNIDRNNIIIGRVQNLKDKKKWLSDILFILPGETPSNTSIDLINIEAENAKLSGYSEDYSSVGYLAMALEEYGEVSITKVGESSGDNKIENNISLHKAFDLDIKYKGRLVNEVDVDKNQDQEENYNLQDHIDIKEVEKNESNQ